MAKFLFHCRVSTIFGVISATTVTRRGCFIVNVFRRRGFRRVLGTDFRRKLFLLLEPSTAVSFSSLSRIFTVESVGKLLQFEVSSLVELLEISLAVSMSTC